jgi:hypothetical protein
MREEELADSSNITYATLSYSDMQNKVVEAVIPISHLHVLLWSKNT